MKADTLVRIAASLLLALCAAACGGGPERHSPEAHMDQNADRYHYSYDDGVCSYQYEYDFKDLTDHLEQHGDCRNVPIQRYHPEAAIAPAYPPPAAAPPATRPSPGAMSAAPSVTLGAPSSAPVPPRGAPSDITVTPVR